MSAGLLVMTLSAVICTALAQLALKLGMSSVPIQTALSQAVQAPTVLAKAMLLEPLLYFGLALYLGSTLIWLFVLAKVELSLAYPFVGLAVVITTLASLLILAESVGPVRWAGVLLIAAGIVLVAQS